MGLRREVKRLVTAIAIIGTLAGCANKAHLSGAEQSILDSRVKKGVVLSENEKDLRNVVDSLNSIRKHLILSEGLIDMNKKTTLITLIAELEEAEKLLRKLGSKGFNLEGELKEVKRLTTIVTNELSKIN